MSAIEESQEDSAEYSISSSTTGTMESQRPRAGNDPGSGRLSAVFLVINVTLGAGLLNFPQAFDQAGGIVPAIAVQAVLILWIVGALLILAHCAEKAGALTLQDVLQAACGQTGLITCSIVVALYCFGTCVTFLIIIGDQFDRVLLSVWGEKYCEYYGSTTTARSFAMICSSTLFVLPLCYSKRIDFLRYVSSIGVIAVLYVVFLIAYQYWMGNFVPGPIKTAPNSWTDVFLVVPAICFGYQCHVSIIPIYSCLKDRTLQNFSFVCMIAMVFCVVAYTVAGVLGYLTFGSLVTSDVLESYAGENPLVLLGIVAIAIKSVTTYPLLQFCGREAINTVWGELCSSDLGLTHLGRRIFITTVWFVTTLFIAVVSPDIGIVIDVLGSLAAIFIFVFPGICLLQSTLRSDPILYLNKNRFLVLAAFVFIIVGTFVFGVVLTQAIERFADISKNHRQSLCE